MSANPVGEALIVHLVPSARAELDALAREQNRDVGELLDEAVASYLEAQRHDIAAIRQGLRQADAGEFASQAEVDAAYAKFR